MSFGHRPIYAVVSNKEYHKLVQGKSAFYELDWQRIDSNMEFIDKDNNYGITFECPIQKNIKPTDHILLAYTYPFNLQDIEYSMNEVK